MALTVIVPQDGKVLEFGTLEERAKWLYDVSANTVLLQTPDSTLTLVDRITIENDGQVTIAAGGLIVSAGRVREVLTPADLDAQSGTLTAAQIVGGILVHTSVTGAGTLTTDTATAIIAGDGGVGDLTANGQCITCLVINDGTQTVTVAGGTDVTIADAGQTIGADEAAVLIFRRTSATAVTCYIVGA